MSFRGILVAALCIIVVALGRLVAEAQASTPTPPPISTATAAASEPATFDIFPWVNGQNTGPVIAKIGEKTCATGVPSAGQTLAHYGLSVPSEEALSGCGREGAVVTFLVDGQQAPQTAIWHSGASQSLTIIIGPPFARFSGVLCTNLRLGDETVVPYVGDESCGDKAPSHWVGVAPYSWGVVVYSKEQRAGCAVDGSQVTFKLLDAQGNVLALANEKGTWHAWDGVSDMQHLDLTFGPAGGITMPGTGTGDGTGDASPWLPLSVGLALVGLAGGISGFALRRRHMTR